MKLTKTLIRRTKEFKTPFLIVDLNQLRENYLRIARSVKDIEVFYAMKANDHPVILKTLAKEGCSFEISSLNELKPLLELKIPSSKIMCFNSIKSPEFLQVMEKKQINVMAFDSKDEVDKIAKYAPSSKLVLRITVTNEGSEWPLTKKFGVDPTEAMVLLEYAKKKKIEVIGLTFHVGSQCLNKNNWGTALYVCQEIWHEALKKNMNLSFISLGGGLPVKHVKDIPTVEEIGAVISREFKKNFKTQGKLRITIEPGRGMIGDCAIMGTSVVGKAIREVENWVYIDVGVFNGLMETIEDFQYEIKLEKAGKRKLVTIGGPSCDSVDIPFKNIMLPEVKLGDRLYIMNAGAYTTVYAAKFNGFDVPTVHFINS